MRILQLVTRNELRGAEVFAGQLSERLCGRGHQVVQAALYRLLDSSDHLTLRDVPQVELLGRIKGRIELGALVRLRTLLRDFRPDVIQANGFHALKYASLLRRMSRPKPPIIYRNISVASRWTTRFCQRAWGSWVCRPVSYVLSVSEASAEDFAAYYRVPAERVRVVRRGIEIPDQADANAMRERLRGLVAAGPEARLLCHVGGFTREKNHQGLLDAFGQLHDVCPNAHLLLFGDGPLRNEIQSRATAAGLTTSVHFFGYRDDARDLVAGADVMLLCSHIEGIPGVVLEAAARRVPAVCTDVGGVSEFVQDGQTGLLVPAGDMPALARAAVRLLEDDALRRQIGENAYQRVREHYDMQRTVDQFEAIYRQVLKEER